MEYVFEELIKTYNNGNKSDVFDVFKNEMSLSERIDFINYLKSCEKNNILYYMFKQRELDNG